MLTIYYTKFSKQLPDKLFLEYLNMLPLNLREKNRRYLRWQDKNAHLFGKLLLLNGLKEHGYSDDILNYLKYNEYGRPYINNNIDFNISHSGEFVICAIGEYMKLGVDIEEIKKLELNDFKHVMSHEQFAIINNSNNPLKTFFKFWCQKESVIKADNRGLSIPLLDIHMNDNVVAYDNQTWHLHEFQFDINYCSYLAVNIPFKNNILSQIEFYK